MFVVSGVPTAVMNVVDVIPVRDRDVTTPFAVPMVVRLVHLVAGGLTFVVVVLVLPVNMTVVHVVHVIPMGDRDVTATRAMDVLMLEMLVMQCAGHCLSPPIPKLDSRLVRPTDLLYLRARTRRQTPATVHLNVDRAQPTRTTGAQGLRIPSAAWHSARMQR